MRLFVALDLRDEVRQHMRELIARLKPKFPKAKWVRPEGMHITLKFIGYVDEEKAHSIAAALHKIHLTDPVDMTFRGVGFFPNERSPRVMWCGIEASPNLAELAAAIETKLEPLEIEPESREFAPHLTLARIPEPKRAGKLVQAASELKTHSFGRAREFEFYLFESVLKPTGAEYKRLQTYLFVKGRA